MVYSLDPFHAALTYLWGNETEMIANCHPKKSREQLHYSGHYNYGYYIFVDIEYSYIVTTRDLNSPGRS